MSSNILLIKDSRRAEDGIVYEVDCNNPPLGEGNFGAVRKGVMVNKNTGEKRDVAIKFLFDDLSKHAINRAAREASIRIENDNLVEMIDFVQVVSPDPYGHQSVHFHVVSELLNGVMLLDLFDGVVNDSEGREVKKAKELYELYLTDREKFAYEIVYNVLTGIMALHNYGYIHRDIDPSNIMITDKGLIKLIDLGIAKELSAKLKSTNHLTSTGDFVGKAAYAAPELVSGDIVNQNATTDIYAIGIMLYQLVVGELPFKGTMHEILKQQMNNDVPVENIDNPVIREIVAKATNKDQNKRYFSAAEFRARMEEAFADKYQNAESAAETSVDENTFSAGSTVADDSFSDSDIIAGGDSEEYGGEESTDFPEPVNNTTDWKTVAVWGATVVIGLVAGALCGLI